MNPKDDNSQQAAKKDDCCSCCCITRRTFALLLLLTAVPISLLLSSSAGPTQSTYSYTGQGLLRECAKWDPQGRRFLVSTFFRASVVEIGVGDDDVAKEERVVIQDADVAGYGSYGLTVDRERGRVVVVYGDFLKARFAAVGAYRLDSWDRIFFTRLSGPDDEPSLADDVAVDREGNAYITDAKSNKIWKVGVSGELVSIIRSKIFTQKKEWYYNFVALNGIIYHPNGYLLVIHTASGTLFKVDTTNEEVSLVRVKGSLFMGDGLEMISTEKIAVAGSVASRVVESSDDWQTATVTGHYVGSLHQRIATSATVKDGKVYVSHLIGWGIRSSRHVIAEAIFTPVNK